MKVLDEDEEEGGEGERGESVSNLNPESQSISFGRKEDGSHGRRPCDHL